MLAGAPFAHELDFSTGLPTGAVIYSVLGNDGTPIVGYDAVSVTPPANSLSILLIVPGSVNTCSKPLFEIRTLVWSYTTTNGVVSDRVRYRVEREVPFPVSTDGVRFKLGVEPDEIEDKAIDLLMAYASLSTQFDLTAYENAGNYNSLIVVNAIESQAALNVLPSLQLAIAKSEDSGTNKYQRFTTIDWDALIDALNQPIYALQGLAGVDTTAFTGVIFTVAGVATDRFTGNEFIS